MRSEFRVRRPAFFVSSRLLVVLKLSVQCITTFLEWSSLTVGKVVGIGKIVHQNRTSLSYHLVRSDDVSGTHETSLGLYKMRTTNKEVIIFFKKGLGLTRRRFKCHWDSKVVYEMEKYVENLKNQKFEI